MHIKVTAPMVNMCLSRNATKYIWRAPLHQQAVSVFFQRLVPLIWHQAKCYDIAPSILPSKRTRLMLFTFKWARFSLRGACSQMTKTGKQATNPGHQKHLKINLILLPLFSSSLVNIWSASGPVSKCKSYGFSLVFTLKEKKKGCEGNRERTLHPLMFSVSFTEKDFLSLSLQLD